ncbi:MAG: hypothetical protein WKG07_26085 [Hymenobacter sp.]
MVAYNDDFPAAAVEKPSPGSGAANRAGLRPGVPGFCRTGATYIPSNAADPEWSSNRMHVSKPDNHAVGARKPS